MDQNMADLQMPPALAQMLTMNPGGEQAPGDMMAPMDGMQQMPDETPEMLAQQIQAELTEALQTGELRPEDLNMLVQSIQVAVDNPQMYPQIRNFLIQRDIVDPMDMPEQYSEEAMGAIEMVAQIGRQMLDAETGQPPMPQQAGLQMGGQMQSLKQGGPVRGAPNKPVPVEAHGGEYVVPKNVVDMKGREFFDRLIEKYKDS